MNQLLPVASAALALSAFAGAQQAGSAVSPQLADANHAVAGSATMLQPWLGAGGAGSRGGAASDDFDRPNSTSMGADWTEQSGDLEILSNQARGALSTGWSYMTHNSASCPPDQSTVTIDLMPPSGSSGPHVAAIMGYNGSVSPWLYTKIQDNDSDGFYDRIFFYSSGNGAGYGSSFFQDLATPIRTGRVSWYLSGGGDIMNVDIDNDFNGTVDQHHDNDGVLGVGANGTGHGVGTWAMGTFDNYDLNGGGGGSFTLRVANLIAGATATLSVANATPGGVVGIAYSLTGGGPTNTAAGPCGTITVDLSNPINVLPLFNADASGNGSLSQAVPAGTTGVSVWLHALDVGSCTLSNSLAEIIG